MSMYVCVFMHACVYLCAQCVCWSEECIQSPGAEFTNCCELQMWVLKTKLRSPARAAILLTTE